MQLKQLIDYIKEVKEFMAKAVHQFRFYQNNASEDRNEPSADAFISVGGAAGFANGDVFKEYYPFY